MARRGKTELEGPDTGKMMRALEQGEAAVHRSSEAVRNQQNIDSQERLRLAETVGKSVGAAQKTYEENRPAKEGSARERKEQMEERKMSLAEKSAESQAAMQQQNIDLKAAEAGRARGPGTPTSPFLDKQTEREKALGAEMDQGAKEMGQYGPSAQGESTQWADQLGVSPPTEEEVRFQEAERKRLNEQLTKPLGDSMFPRTEEGKKTQKFKQSQEREKRDISRMNAMTRKKNAETAWWKAHHAGDKAAKANQKEVLMGPVRHGSDARDAMVQGMKPTGQALEWILDQSAGNEAYDIIKNWDTATPEQHNKAIDFVKNHIDNTLIAYVKGINQLPDSDYVDEATPKAQSLFQNIARASNFTKNIGGGTYLGFKSGPEKAMMMRAIGVDLTERGLGDPNEMIAGGATLPSGLPPDQQQEGPQTATGIAGSILTQGVAGGLGPK